MNRWRRRIGDRHRAGETIRGSTWVGCRLTVKGGKTGAARPASARAGRREGDTDGGREPERAAGHEIHDERCHGREHTKKPPNQLSWTVRQLRGGLEPGDTLIIDEIEAHLHPAAQTQMATLLARLVRAGVRVLITTHSDWLLKELGNLMREGELADQTAPSATAARTASPSRSCRGTPVAGVSSGRDAPGSLVADAPSTTCFTERGGPAVSDRNRHLRVGVRGRRGLAGVRPPRIPHDAQRAGS